MKRLWILLLMCMLVFTGCKKEEVHLPGNTEIPEGVDWRLWEAYTPASLQMGGETVEAQILVDAISCSVYYDREDQTLLGSFLIYTPLSDLDYSREHLRILDKNGDGYDDICVPDMLKNGDRTLQWWLWDPKAEAYLYAPEYIQTQEDIAADISWQEGKAFIAGSMDTPEGPQDVLILVQDQQILIYLDQRKEQLWGSAQIPEPLSQEALSRLELAAFWDCHDLNGDGWGDLELPCRWETAQGGVFYQYAHHWHWNPETETYRYEGVSTQS